MPLIFRVSGMFSGVMGEPDSPQNTNTWEFFKIHKFFGHKFEPGSKQEAENFCIRRVKMPLIFRVSGMFSGVMGEPDSPQNTNTWEFFKIHKFFGHKFEPGSKQEAENFCI